MGDRPDYLGVIHSYIGYNGGRLTADKVFKLGEIVSPMDSHVTDIVVIASHHLPPFRDDII